MRIKLKRISPIILAASCLLFSLPLFGQNEREGMRLFEMNKGAEAIAFLEADIEGGNPLPEEYNYLGLAYYQMGNYEKSVAAFKKGCSAKGTNKKILYLKLFFI